MKATRIAIALGFYVVGAAVVGPFLAHSLAGDLAAAGIYIALMVIATLLISAVRSPRNTDNREAHARRVTGMQLLNLDEVEYDGPATRHYPEGGDR